MDKKPTITKRLLTAVATSLHTTHPIKVRLEGVMKSDLPRTGLSGLAVILLCALFTLTPSASCQQPPQQVAPNPFTAPLQISFFVPVDVNNVNQLIQMVNAQVNAGRKDFVILISSQGGEVLSGLAAYNYLHGLHVNITTYNLGQVDSAANLLFCAGQHRYALPNTRFLIHSSFTLLPPGTPLNTAYLDGQLQQVRNMNQMSAQVIESAIGKPSKEVEQAIEGQNIFDPQEALKLGLIQEVKANFSTPGAVIASIDSHEPNPNPAQGSTMPLSSAGVKSIIPQSSSHQESISAPVN